MLILLGCSIHILKFSQKGAKAAPKTNLMTSKNQDQI